MKSDGSGDMPEDVICTPDAHDLRVDHDGVLPDPLRQRLVCVKCGFVTSGPDPKMWERA